MILNISTMELDYFLKRAILFESVEQFRPLNIVTLFSGMGAPEIALDKLGVNYNVLLASEYDSTAQSIYKQLHHSRLHALVPDVYDILKKKSNRYINKDILNRTISAGVDLLIAGFPCQAFSSAGKNYGFNSRRVYKLGKTNKSYVVHAKEHLENPAAEPGTVTTIKDSAKFPLDENINLQPGDSVVISSDSDGTLSIETLKIIEKLKPTVAILENVSRFKNADYLEDDDLVTESAIVGKTEFISKPGAFMKELQRRFSNMNYTFYPFMLDPTSYIQGSIQRRPRVYMVAIKNRVANRLNKIYQGNINKLFGVDILQKAEDTSFSSALAKALEMVFKSRYSTLSGFLTNDPKKFLPKIVARFSKKDFIKACSLLLTDAANMIKHGDTRSLEEIISEAYSYDTEVKDILSRKYSSRIPRIIDLKDEDTQSFIDKLLNFIDNNGGFNETYLNKVFPAYTHFPTFDNEWEEIADDKKVIIESTSTENIDSSVLKKYIVKFILKQYIGNANKNPGGHKTLPTIMKGFNFSSTQHTSEASPLFIFRDKKGEIRWGFIHPALQMRFMGMLSKNDSDIYKSVGNITDKKFNDTIYKTMASGNSINDIMARIGNSMSVDVLEKLFRSLINAGVFNHVSFEEDEECMSSADMFPSSPALIQGDNYAPGDNRVPGLLFKKPVKRKKITESAKANSLESAFKNGIISAWEYFDKKSKEVGHEITADDIMFFDNPEKWADKQPATKEEIDKFLADIKEMLKDDVK